MAYVPQEHGLPFPYRVRDVVLMGRTPHVAGWLLHPGRTHHDVAMAALERVGIAELAERAYPELSGGQRQLVLIARAPAQATPIMLPVSTLRMFADQVLGLKGVLHGQLVMSSTAVWTGRRKRAHRHRHRHGHVERQGLIGS